MADVGISVPQIDDPEVDDPEVPVDQTSLQIAEMLNLDLSTCTNTESGTKVVVDAIYKLIEQYQECVQENADLQGQIQQHEQDQQDQLDQQQQGQVDENGNPIPPDPNDPNAVDPNDPNAVDENGDPLPPEEENPDDIQPQPNTGLPNQGPPAKKPNPFAAKGKKPAPKNNPFAKKSKGIAASFPASVMKMASENRIMKLNNLASAGIINGEVYKDLKKKFVSNDSITLSLSQDDGDDSFDLFLSMLEKNGPVINYGENSAGHTNLVELALSNSKPVKSPLVADAESRQ